MHISFRPVWRQQPFQLPPTSFPHRNPNCLPNCLFNCLPNCLFNCLFNCLPNCLHPPQTTKNLLFYLCRLQHYHPDPLRQLLLRLPQRIHPDLLQVPPLRLRLLFHHCLHFHLLHRLHLHPRLLLHRRRARLLFLNLPHHLKHHHRRRHHRHRSVFRGRL